jgi:hypothetical protein
MRRLTYAVAVGLLFHLAQPALARKWPGDDGKLVDGELILNRDSVVVVRLEGPWNGNASSSALEVWVSMMRAGPS